MKGTVGTGAIGPIAVDIVASNPGSYAVTSGDLTSSSGNSGTATATLQVLALAPSPIAPVPVLDIKALLLLNAMLALCAMASIRRVRKSLRETYKVH